ncbi:mediator of DNA damage checkpoint protein 1 [Cariama cristata]
MHRRRHRGLSTVGGTGPLPGDAASPRVVPESDPEESDVCPDVQRPRKRCHTLAWGHLPDVAAPCPDPDVRGPKKRRFGPQTTPDPHVGRKMAIPNVQPQNHSLNPKKVANPDVKHLEGSNPTLDIENDTDVKVPPKTALFHPNHHWAALEVSSNPDVEERGPNPDVGGAKNGCQIFVVDSDTDVEEAEVLPDSECPKIRRMAPNMPKPPRVEMENLNPDVGGPKNGCQALVDSDTDVEMESLHSAFEGPKNGHELLTVDSDTDVEEDRTNPDAGGRQTHQMTQNVPKKQNTETEMQNADVDISQKGHQMLVVDSDTDVEENGANPDVGYPKTHQTAQNIPKKQFTDMETHNADVESSPKGHEMLMVDSDTDVEEDTSNPDVGCPESHRTALRDPDVKTETTNQDGEGQQTLLVETDTDVEEDTSNPDVGTPETHGATQNATRNPHVEVESAKTCAEGPQNEHWTLVVDSDTDVEENEMNPDVGCPKIRRITQKDPDVEMKNPNPDVKEPPNEHCNLEVDSDTDVEEDLSQGVLCPKSHKTPPNTRKATTVVMETPNPDVGGLSHGSVPSSGDSDTDVEDLSALPNVEAPKTHGTTHEVMDTGAKMAAVPDVDPEGRRRTNDNPDVKVSFSNPDVGAPKAQCPVLNVDSDRDVEDNGVIPDVGTVQGCHGASGDPDVAATSPNPDVSPPTSPQDNSDTDVEEVAPTPDVRGRRRRIQFQNHPHPDVGPATDSGTNVEETDPKCWKLSAKRQDLPPKSECDASAAEMVPENHDLALNTDVEAPNPDVGAQRHNRETPMKGKDPAVPPDVSAPKSPRLDPNLGVAADADGGPRSAGATTVGVTGAPVTESDTDAEEDPDLFLEPTQNFLPPAAKGAAQDWDPEEPTQPFFPPEEEEEEEEEEQPPQEPPQDHPDTWVPPAEPVTATAAQEGAGTRAASGGEVREGPRRSQRLARSQGGGATGGGASGEGGASRARGRPQPVTAPPRRSPRLQAQPPPPELPVMRGRGQVEPRPPAKPRLRRASPAPSQRQAQEEEKASSEVTRPQLRPRGGSGSAPPKVLFTGVVASPGMEVALRTLGGSMATSVFDCTHLVTDRVRRTVKFLCAVARGVPIVTPEWLHQSARSGRVLVPGPFLVRDSQQERHFGFSLAQALRRARRHPLLQGYEVHVTPNVRPEPEHMRDIVTCGGGTFLPTMPHTYAPRRVVISCEADAGCWAPALGARLPLASAELLLTGLLRQHLQLQPFLLPPPATPPDSHGNPSTPPGAPTAPPGVPCHPPGAAQEPPGTPGSPRGPGEVPARGRSRRPPRDPPRNPPSTRQRLVAPPAPQ